MISRNDPCWCGSGKKWKKCHAPQLPPGAEAERLRERYRQQYGIRLKTPEEIEGIRRACRLTAEVLDKVCAKTVAGVTTGELDDLAAELAAEAGATSAALHYGYPPFPKSICTSLNEVICHGIPGERVLVEGDIVNIDISLVLDGFYGDCSRMVVIGKTSEERQLVVDVALECLNRAIAVCRPGAMIREIGEAIESYAVSKECSVVHQFVAHGVGCDFHEPPQIPHGRNELRIPMAPGMTFTIEPMINAGVAEAVIDPIDQWTAKTVDGKASGQWEHTLLITESGVEILTGWESTGS
jgi:methionyl aminopeptidase